LDGALAEFADAYNLDLYSLANPDAAVNSIPSVDLFGSEPTITTALGEVSFSLAIGVFLVNGLNDLFGYL
jgi:hypothetical protein